MATTSISSFQRKKQRILDALGVPLDKYTDLSPKGSVDVQIRDLIDEINAIPGLVTTSSCAGRVSVFVEGPKRSKKALTESNDEYIDGADDKAGDRWLYVSHEPAHLDKCIQQGWLVTLGLAQSQKADIILSSENHDSLTKKLLHFKFEPMILHLQASSLKDANAVLIAANQAGFRESGAMNLSPSEDGNISPMVAVRSMGLGFDSVIGYQYDDGSISISVDESHLETLVKISNDRFEANSERIARFRENMKRAFTFVADQPKEDYESRRQRKKAEGLARQQEARRTNLVVSDEDGTEEVFGEYDLDMQTSKNSV